MSRLIPVNRVMLAGIERWGVDERMPLANDFVIADFYSADLSNTVAVRPAAGCLDIDDNVILLRVEPEVDASNFGSNSCVIKLAQTRQLVTADACQRSSPIGTRRFAARSLGFDRLNAT